MPDQGVQRRPLRYLVGVPGAPNYGDEVLVRGWLRWLASNNPDDDVVVDTPHPGGAQALLGEEHPRVKFVDTLWRLCWEAPNEDPWDAARFVTSALRDHGQAPNWIPGLRWVDRADSIHLVGGGFLNDIWPRRLGMLAALAEMNRRGTPTAVTGAGFAPVSARTADLLRALVGELPVVDVRDEASAELIRRPGARSGDDLWVTDLDSLLDRERAAEFDGVLCIQDDIAEVAADDLARRALREIHEWQVDPARIAVVECVPRADRVVFDRLWAVVPQMQFLGWTELLDRGVPAGPGQRWLSTRFHPHLVAAWAGARGTALDVRPDYYGPKHLSLTAAGSTWAVERDGVVVEPGSADPDAFRLHGVEVHRRKVEIARGVYGPGPGA
ncbi:hypothetical protein GCM10011381_20710 [Klenkia taihuensis]|uniref:Polysaccharide pyruvyl transferase n=1 Tax=Klenkia taihuensis TaxID=1225127 RepID=A0A1I1K276_9ACTN|nr:hypothetical protein GCM10011381_20710 [Klenkia taihuensis]SFC52858.1 Polysaccharide pyruvyl transferase [Klenkia taihuensis]